MGLLPQYKHIINPKLKHTYLTFDAEGNLIIKSPKVSQYYLEKLLLKKSNWINLSREKILQKKGRGVNFSKEPKLFFLGKSYPLVLQKHTSKRTSLCFENEQFVLSYHHYDESIFQKKISHFYKEEAKKIIPLLVEEWSSKMSLEPSMISFRKTKSQWGSCSGKNALSFNSMMMKLPLNVIQYIIVHELAHIKHKHHQKSFWELVAKYMPHYKKLVAELKTYTTY